MSVESPRWMVGALLLGAAIGASAAPKVYRCGPDGAPPAGAVRRRQAVDAADPRTAGPAPGRAGRRERRGQGGSEVRPRQPARVGAQGGQGERATAPAASDAKSATAKKPAEPDKPTVYVAPAKPKPASAPNSSGPPVRAAVT